MFPAEFKPAPILAFRIGDLDINGKYYSPAGLSDKNADNLWPSASRVVVVFCQFFAINAFSTGERLTIPAGVVAGHLKRSAFREELDVQWTKAE